MEEKVETILRSIEEQLSDGNDKVSFQPKETVLTTEMLSAVLQHPDFEPKAGLIKSMVLRGHQLDALPSSLGNIPNLKKLDVRQNQGLKAVEPGCFLNHLDVFDAGEVGMSSSSLSGFLSAFKPGVTRLELDINQLNELPAVLSKFVALNRMNLNANSLTMFPPVVLEMPSLRELLMNSNRIEHLPDDFKLLTGLTALELKQNSLRSLPASLAQMKSLARFLYDENPLDSCAFRNTPSPWEEFKGFLQQICVQSGQTFSFDAVAQEFVASQQDGTYAQALPIITSNPDRLQNITDVRLVGLALEDLPPQLFQLKKLQFLSLARNRLRQIPHSIEELAMLETLDISFNPINILPASMGVLTRLKTLRTRGTPWFLNPPQEILDSGVGKVLVYLREILQDKVSNKKILLVAMGAGEAGKTSMVNALINEASGTSKHIDAETGRTIGIDIKAWLPTEGDGLEFSAMDVGGQAVYHTIHQFFLTQRSLFVLVWRLRELRGAPPDEHNMRAPASLLDWFDGLQLKLPGSRVVLVATHADAISPDSTELQVAFVRKAAMAKADQTQPVPGGDEESGNLIPPLSVAQGGRSFVIDSRSGRGVAALRSALVREAEALPFFGEHIPRSFLALRQRLAALRGEGQTKWMEWDTYAAMGQECGLDEVQLDVASRFLHSTGELRHFLAEGTALVASQLVGTQWAVTGEFNQHKGPCYLWLMSGGRHSDLLAPGSVVYASEGSRWRVTGPHTLEFSDLGFYIKAGDSANQRYWRKVCLTVRFNGSFTEFAPEGECKGTENGADHTWDAEHMRRHLNAGALVGSADIAEKVASCGLLISTVFVDPGWIIDVLKGLIRHDRSLLLQYGERLRDTALIRHTRRLVVHGILHPSLLPFLWPGDEAAAEFWLLVSDSPEAASWEDNPKLVDGEHCLERIVALLKAFDIVMVRAGSEEHELVVPSLLDGTLSHSVDARTFAQHDVHLSTRLHYSGLPPGFFERVLVNAGANASHVTFSAHVAAMYVRGTKAQLCISSADGGVRNVLTLAASTRELWRVVLDAVQHVERGSPGLQRTRVEYSFLDKAGRAVRPAVRRQNSAEILEDEGSVESDGEYDDTADVECCLALPEPCRRLCCPAPQPSSRPEELSERVSQPSGAAAGIAEPLRMDGREGAKKHKEAAWTALAMEELSSLDAFQLPPDPVAVEVFGAVDLGKRWPGMKLRGRDLRGEEQDATSPYLTTKPLPNPFDNLSLSFRWKDQGWGNRKGRVYLLLKRAGQTICEVGYQELGLAPHERAKVRLDITPESLNSRCAAFQQSARAGDIVEVWYETGGGGGHELNVEGLELALSFETGGFESDATHSTAASLLSALRSNSISASLSRDPAGIPAPTTRLALLLIDADVGSAKAARGVLQAASESESLDLVALICPGFSVTDYAKWWPPELALLENYSLFQDLRKGSAEQLKAAIGVVEEKLERWRGSLPSGLHAGQPSAGETRRQVGADGRAQLHEALPCPRCVRQGRAPPQCFSRDKCLLFLDDVNDLKKGQVMCDACGSVPIGEVLCPEVFLSYNWGPKVAWADGSTQPETQFLVKELRRRIEDNTKLLCWLDVSPAGMSAGDNHVLAMKAGIEQAVLVVVFLSDLYLKSINCLFEFRVAAASGVYLLPVLVRGWSGEYGGPQDAEWWHHAEKTAGPLEVGQEGAHKGWAALAATTPLDFRKVDPTKEDTDEEQQLIRRILGRFHRGGGMKEKSAAALWK